MYQRNGREYVQTIGSLFSSLLLAGGEDNEPVAVSGRLDDNGTGELVVVYGDVITVATITELKAQSGEFVVTVHSFDDVKRLRVSTRHSYYVGTSEQPRHSGIEVSLVLDEREIAISAGGYARDPLVSNDAVLSAFERLRAHKLTPSMAPAGS